MCPRIDQTMTNPVLWDTVPHNPSKVSEHFGETNHFHLHGSKNKPSKKSTWKQMAHCFPDQFILQPWRWKIYVPLEEASGRLLSLLLFQSFTVDVSLDQHLICGNFLAVLTILTQVHTTDHNKSSYISSKHMTLLFPLKM